MFCPKCGAEGQAVNAYCKRCGEWLPDVKDITRPKFGGSSPEENAKNLLFMSAFSTVFALFSAIALYANHLGRDDVNWSVFVAAAFCLTIACWQLSNLFITVKLLKRLKRARQTGDADAPVAIGGRTSELPGLGAGAETPFVAQGSVTEGTTRTLDPVPRGGLKRERKP